MTQGAAAQGIAGEPLVVASSNRRYNKVLRLIQRKARAQERLRQVEIKVDYELGMLRDEALAAGEEL